MLNSLLLSITYGKSSRVQEFHTVADRDILLKSSPSPSSPFPMLDNKINDPCKRRDAGES